MTIADLEMMIGVLEMRTVALAKVRIAALLVEMKTVGLVVMKIAVHLEMVLEASHGMVDFAVGMMRIEGANLSVKRGSSAKTVNLLEKPRAERKKQTLRSPRTMAAMMADSRWFVARSERCLIETF